ncbi:L-xylo-3-hexulose reductase [Erysiphe neolycopersici]|uniref:L-xylo-3-hexulose reductase n=1 Tax=Erysiphe neolycopersici TaxID=212602 RepID=A0A420HL05_9PEZI|nr:L-xylo-3-hexulose reductase [Erysiphe neolycopersici]
MIATTTSFACYRPLEGKLALVTGASRGQVSFPKSLRNDSQYTGIGTAIAFNLASKGARLILNHSAPASSQMCRELALELQDRYGVEHLVVQANMGTVTGPGDLIQKAAARISNLKIDIIVNNAGVLTLLKIADINIEAFDLVYHVNVRGPLLLMKAALPNLPNDRSGRIVNISSISATVGGNGQSIYGGSKAALNSMTRTWSRELAECATVNSINPGPVSTELMRRATSSPYSGFNRSFFELTPLSRVREGVDDDFTIDFAGIHGGRPAYVEEIAGIVSMLVSNESGWCTGQVICANGGFRMAT